MHVVFVVVVVVVGVDRIGGVSDSYMSENSHSNTPSRCSSYSAYGVCTYVRMYVLLLPAKRIRGGNVFSVTNHTA